MAKVTLDIPGFRYPEENIYYLIKKEKEIMIQCKNLSKNDLLIYGKNVADPNMIKL